MNQGKYENKSGSLEMDKGNDENKPENKVVIVIDSKDQEKRDIEPLEKTSVQFKDTSELSKKRLEKAAKACSYKNNDLLSRWESNITSKLEEAAKSIAANLHPGFNALSKYQEKIQAQSGFKHLLNMNNSGLNTNMNKLHEALGMNNKIDTFSERIKANNNSNLSNISRNVYYNGPSENHTSLLPMTKNLVPIKTEDYLKNVMPVTTNNKTQKNGINIYVTPSKDEEGFIFLKGLEPNSRLQILEKIKKFIDTENYLTASEIKIILCFKENPSASNFEIKDMLHYSISFIEKTCNSIRKKFGMDEIKDAYRKRYLLAALATELPEKKL